MKNIQIAIMMLVIGLPANAQDSYFNDQLVNNAGDVHGTARYVGMGGAMGALGADISTINWNPAGIGLYRRGDVAFTAGAAWNKKGIDEASTTNATFDQAGFVYSLDLGEYYGLRYLNFSFNYQKKIDYNNGFYADNLNLGGRSQMSQLMGLANAGFDTNNNLAGMAVDNWFLTAYDKSGALADKYTKRQDIDHFENSYDGIQGFHTQQSSGSLGEYSFNVSGNVNDQVYWGVTFGLDDLRYRGWSDYYEQSIRPTDKVKGDYSLYNDHYINGMGFSVKAGVIVRPFAESPFRVALAAETPTWYQLKKSTLYSLTDNVINYQVPENESYLEYSIKSPWKVRAGIGSTLGNFLAWDVDYEYATYNHTGMGYPTTYVDDPNSSLFNNTWDKAMDKNTLAFLKPTHNVRAGIEFKPVRSFSIRAGYNFASSAYKDNIALNQLNINSYAMNYATTTSFMRLGDLHSITAGLGWKGRHFYFDLAYKCKIQSADHYAFDATSQGSALTPVNADLTRHQITASLGFKF